MRVYTHEFNRSIDIDGFDQVIVNRIDLYLFTHTYNKGSALKGTRNLNTDLIHVNTYNNIIEYTSRCGNKIK